MIVSAFPKFKFLIKITLSLLLTLNMFAANAELIRFSYTFDANSLGTPGHILTGVIDGTILDDSDTILINNFLSVSLAGFDYEKDNFIGIRAANFGDQPVMSLSGDTLDFWVCPQGFTSPDGIDCPFGSEGGFLVSDYWPPNPNFQCAASGAARAGIPELGYLDEENPGRYRDQDCPINRANWSAEVVTSARISFSYTFDANRRGTPGHVLSGVIDGIILEDNDTIEIVRFREASLAGFDYDIDGKHIGIRSANFGDKAVMSLSGNTLDFWVCVQGFTGNGSGNPNDPANDCPFGAEGGFLVSDFWPFSNPGGAIAGIPELSAIEPEGLGYRDVDIPHNLSNWSAEIAKLNKPKKPKKLKKIR